MVPALPYAGIRLRRLGVTVIVHLVLVTRMDMLVFIQFGCIVGVAMATAYVIVFVLVLVVMTVSVSVGVRMRMLGSIRVMMGVFMLMAVFVFMTVRMGMIVFHAISSVSDKAGRDPDRRTNRINRSLASFPLKHIPSPPFDCAVDSSPPEARFAQRDHTTVPGGQKRPLSRNTAKTLRGSGRFPFTTPSLRFSYRTHSLEKLLEHKSSSFLN